MHILKKEERTVEQANSPKDSEKENMGYEEKDNKSVNKGEKQNFTEDDRKYEEGKTPVTYTKVFKYGRRQDKDTLGAEEVSRGKRFGIEDDKPQLGEKLTRYAAILKLKKDEGTFANTRMI